MDIEIPKEVQKKRRIRVIIKYGSIALAIFIENMITTFIAGLIG